MSTPTQIINQIISQLEDSSDLSYIKQVSEMKRANLAEFPYIIVAPLTDQEEEYIHNVQDVFMQVGLLVYIKNYDVDKHMTGSGSIKGLADVRNDIAKAIYADRQLNDLAEKADITEVNYDEFSDFPVSGMAISLTVHFRQTAMNRT